MFVDYIKMSCALNASNHLVVGCEWHFRKKEHVLSVYIIELAEEVMSQFGNPGGYDIKESMAFIFSLAYPASNVHSQPHVNT